MPLSHRAILILSVAICLGLIGTQGRAGELPVKPGTRIEDLTVGPLTYHQVQVRSVNARTLVITHSGRFAFTMIPRPKQRRIRRRSPRPPQPRRPSQNQRQSQRLPRLKSFSRNLASPRRSRLRSICDRSSSNSNSESKTRVAVPVARYLLSSAPWNSKTPRSAGGWKNSLRNT